MLRDRLSHWLPLLATIAVTAVPLAGCGEAEQEAKLGRRTIPSLAEVPEPVMQVARETLPEVEFQDAWKNVTRDGATHSYEIRGRTAEGQIREVRVSPEGKVLELE